MQTANDQEELEYLCTTDPAVRLHFEKKMTAKRACFERYRAYIQKEIAPGCVAPIRETWIRSILDSITANFAQLNPQTAEQLIDEMLAVINCEYYYSGRKAILDYVLKDADERNRIGIVRVLQPIEEWGCSTRRSIRLSVESVKLTARAR